MGQWTQDLQAVALGHIDEPCHVRRARGWGRLAEFLHESLERHDQGLLARADQEMPSNAILRDVLSGYIHAVAAMRDALTADWTVPDRPLLCAAVGHGIAFGTWHSLAIGQGLSDERDAALMERRALGATVTESWPGGGRPSTPVGVLKIMLDNKSCRRHHRLMLDIHVIDDPAAATVAMEPMRSRLLSELAAPASAATLATRVGLTRQKVNYHLHALEAHGLVRLAQERKWGGLTERLVVATAASYVVSPSALGPAAVDPAREVDRLSASYLIALGARVIREVADLLRHADETGLRLATLSVDTEVRFRSATDRAAFSQELTEAIASLVSRYHDGSAPGGRAHRLVVVAHPLPEDTQQKEPS